MAKAPFAVDADVTGIQERRWQIGQMRTSAAALNDVRASKRNVTEELESQRRHLTTVFNRLTDAFGIREAITAKQLSGSLKALRKVHARKSFLVADEHLFFGAKGLSSVRTLRVLACKTDVAVKGLRQGRFWAA